MASNDNITDSNEWMRQWNYVGHALHAALPEGTRMRLLIALARTARAATRDIGDVIDGVAALHEIAHGGRCRMNLEELLLLIQARTKDALDEYHAGLRERRRGRSS